MNNDRELLELAAKAAGIEWASTSEGFADGYWKFSDGKTQSWWNPLTDDGDALRLAVNLNLKVMCRELGAGAYSQDGKITVSEFAEDPYAATRRAIVRAAAEIGKEQK